MNTGFKQGVIAYKVSLSDGAPLDVNGQPISVSGLKQAIHLLTGTVNPMPDIYQVEGYFNAEDTVDGVPTLEVSNDCAAGYIFLSASQLVFDATTAPQALTLTSSADWTLDTPPGAYVSGIPSSGAHGVTAFSVARTTTLGQGFFTFRNTHTNQTVQVYIINVNTRDWILAAHAWNMLGFWMDASIWGA